MTQDDVIVELAPRVVPEGTEFHTEKAGKISESSVCQMCGYSLPWCKHETPRVTTKKGTEEVIRKF